MKFLNGIRKYEKIKTSIMLILIGVLFLFVGCLFIFNKEDVACERASATISKIEEVTTNDDIEYKVYVDYVVDNKAYTDIEYKAYSSGMKEGEIIEVCYKVDNPDELYIEGSESIVYIIVILGLVSLGLGIFYLIKSIKTKVKDMNEYDKVDLSKVDKSIIDEIKDRKEKDKKYTFHYDKNFKQGYVMEDKDNNIVYEGKMVKMTLLIPFTFDFINHITKGTITRKIGHTVSTYMGSGDDFIFEVPITKSFTVDGVNNWDYLASNGYSFEMKMNKLVPNFIVRHYGVDVAKIKTIGTNAITKKDYKLGNIPLNGCYEVTCKESDLDMIFMVCMSIARAIFYEK